MKETALLAFAREMHGRPFHWGETDCAVLALQALDALRGTDHAGRWERAWSSEAEALHHFQIELPSEVLRNLGLTEIAPALAAVGDVLLAPKGAFPECAHVVLGRFALASSPEAGVHYVSTAALVAVATSAWRPG